MANSSLTKQERLSNRIKIVSSANSGVKKTVDSDMQKNEPGPLSYSIHKNKLKMDERPKSKTGSHQNPQGESSKTSLILAAATSYSTRLQRQGKQRQK